LLVDAVLSSALAEEGQAERASRERTEFGIL
jgi:hypothetical protein